MGNIGSHWTLPQARKYIKCFLGGGTKGGAVSPNFPEPNIWVVRVDTSGKVVPSAY